MAEKTLAKLVGAKFAPKHVDSAVGHYQKAVEEFQLGKWETSIAKGGKFVEAVLKALWSYVGEAVPTGIVLDVNSSSSSMKQMVTAVQSNPLSEF